MNASKLDFLLLHVLCGVESMGALEVPGITASVLGMFVVLFHVAHIGGAGEVKKFALRNLLPAST